jgi:hypothetical protein
MDEQGFSEDDQGRFRGFGSFERKWHVFEK